MTGVVILISLATPRRLGQEPGFDIQTSPGAPSPAHTAAATEPGPIETAPSPTQTEALPPLQFSFPSPGIEPVSAWRPPLYPVPWAPTAFDHFYFIRPIAADEVNWPAPNYRYGGVFFEDVVHTGIDIDAPIGAPVQAAGPGKVIWAGYGLYSGSASEDDPYGLAVAIRHEFGFQGRTLYTIYGHLSEVEVTRGQLVETGDQIGLVGDTGFTTGPHLHFEVRVIEADFYTTYNPELWIAPPQGWALFVARVMGTGSQLLFNQEVFFSNLETEQVWQVVTYGADVGANSDPYYRENLVIGDLPAGNYEVRTPYLGRTYTATITLQPGRVTYFTFRGRDGFDFSPPALPETNFTPAAP